MKRLANCLWRDEHGVILSTEIVIIGSVLVVGLITGMVSLQEAVNREMEDVAGAIGSLNQSYRFTGQETDCRKCYACTAGSFYRDQPDDCNRNHGDIAAGRCDDVRRVVVSAEEDCSDDCQEQSESSPICQETACDPCGTSCDHCSSCREEASCGPCGHPGGCSHCGHRGHCGHCSHCSHCGHEGRTGFCGRCGTCSTGPACLSGPRTVETGVPRMKVTEWPLNAPVIESPIVEAGGTPCVPCTGSTGRRPFLNIPESVW